MATERPAIGERVTLLAPVGVEKWIGREAVVIAHHEDGIAFVVALDGDARFPIMCDPDCVEVVAHVG